mmetsp:Transcript_139536/g.389192  ORF Transcript_139536/g.389192 Transcript_139536/m.389192 type:complete len:234 (+) Transcript_139536:240-941(+)
MCTLSSGKARPIASTSFAKLGRLKTRGKLCNTSDVPAASDSRRLSDWATSKANSGVLPAFCCGGASASRLLRADCTQSTSWWSPLTQQAGHWGAAGSVLKLNSLPVVASKNLRRSSLLCRRNASLKRKACASRSGSLAVMWRWRMILFRSWGLLTMLVRSGFAKRNSSAERVIQKKWTCLRGSFLFAKKLLARLNGQRRWMIVDMRDRKGVTPTPAPTTMRTSCPSAVCVGAA